MSTAILAQAISTLEQRLGSQESRILHLEKEVRQQQIDRIVNGGSFTPQHTANVALYSKYLYHHAKTQCLMRPSTPYHQQQHLIAHPNSQPISTVALSLIPVTINSTPCHSYAEVKAPEGPSPGGTMESSNNQSPYHSDDLNAFESRLCVNHKANSISVMAPPPRELPVTLLEGIGSAEQITHHHKDDGSGDEICDERNASVSCMANSTI